MFTTLTEMFDAAYDGSIAGRTVSAELAAMFECYGGCWVMREGNVHCIHDLLKNKYAPAGIRTRVLWTKTIDAGPDYTTGA